MGFATRFAWFALPLLAGCGALSAVSAQSANNASGGGSRGDLNFPEDRNYLEDAGLGDALRYAKYLRPNVGFTDQSLGMSISKLRKLEVQIRDAVTAEDPADVAARFKRQKYGIENIGPGAPDLPEELQRNPRLIKLDDPAIKPALDEMNNFRKTPFSINKDMAEYVLGITDKVLQSNGISPMASSNRLIRAKAFVLGTYYLFTDIPNKHLNECFGNGAGNVFLPTGVFGLDKPRGACSTKSSTLIFMVDSLSQELGVYAMEDACYLKGGELPDKRTNHSIALISYRGCNVVEGYDLAYGRKIDSKDEDTAATWVTSYNGTTSIIKSGLNAFLINGKKVGPGQPDPISALPRAEFDALPESVWGPIARALDPTYSFSGHK